MSSPVPTLRVIQILAASLVMGVVMVVGVLIAVLNPWAGDRVFEPVIQPVIAIPVMAMAAFMMFAAPSFLSRVIGPERAVSAEDWALRLHREIIVTFAVMEGSAILLVLMGFFSGLANWGVVGAAMALFLMALRFPTSARIEARVGAMGDVQSGNRNSR